MKKARKQDRAPRPAKLGKPAGESAAEVAKRSRWSSPRLFYSALFGGALLLRLIYLLEISGTPMTATPIGDGESYHAWARAIAGGDWLGDEVFYQAPLYPYFMGLLYSLFGPHLIVIRIVQALLGAGSCLLLAGAGERFFDRTTGRLTGVLLAVYPTALYFDGLIQKTSLAFFLFALILFLVSRLAETPRKRGWYACGAVLGLMSINRENALVLLPVLVIWLWFAFRARSPRQRLIWCGLFVAGLVTILFPLTLRNRVVAGQWVLTTSNLGINFYIGNNERADGRYAPLRPGRGDWKFERSDAAAIARSETGRELDAAEVSRFWLDKTLVQIRAQPGRWLRLMGRKLLLVWNATEIADTEDIYTYAGWSILLKTTRFVFHFGVLCPLAVIGLFASWRQRERLWVLYLIALAYAGSVAIFFVFDRFRFPLAGALMPFAAAGILKLRETLRTGAWKALAPPLVCAALVAVCVNLSLVPRTDFAANSHLNLGNILARQGEYAKAIDHYQQAIAARPDRAEAHIALANACLKTGRYPEAIDHLNKAASLRPGFAEVPAQLGLVHLVQGHTAQAIDFLSRALELDAHHAEALNNLAWLLATTKDAAYRDGARAVGLAERVNADSDQPNPDRLDTLAAAYAATGDFAKAIAAAERAVALARDAGDTRKATAISERLQGYRESKPYIR